MCVDDGNDTALIYGACVFFFFFFLSFSSSGALARCFHGDTSSRRDENTAKGAKGLFDS